MSVWRAADNCEEEKVDKKRDLVVNLFGKFDKVNEFASGSNGPRLVWTMNDSMTFRNKNTSLDFPYKKELDVTNDRETICTLFDKFKVIQLRNWKGEKKLILGCGNNPVFWGSCALKAEYQDSADDNNKKWLKFGTKHQHRGCYTIDPDIGMNPSIVGQFGIRDMKPFLPKNHFKEIHFENFMLSTSDEAPEEKYKNVCTIDNLLYLLKEGGIVTRKGGGSEFQFKKDRGELYCVQYPTLVLQSDEVDQFDIFAKIYCLLEESTEPYDE